MHGIGDGTGAVFCLGAGIQHGARAFTGTTGTCVDGLSVVRFTSAVLIDTWDRFEAISADAVV